ncbi:hypothetical protein KUTeg_023479 [Tegillarca granosa]|uniref:GOLD domain-containing protein n=1 Tax=Tegillarca granosa TaxID=220873 RepID=A0ABQ9E1S7_TEGGR|nr:hypothetical protein KUTeg_023479 [Tegillarca granosa]
MGSSLQKVLLVYLLSILSLCNSLEIDLTADIAAGYKECFFQNIKKVVGMEVEYQVIDGGDMDIDFELVAPNGNIVVSETSKSDAVHKIDAAQPGDYKLCFDNTFSTFARKIVFFEIITDEDEDEDEDKDKKWDTNAAKEELANIVDMTIEDFKKLMDSVENNLDKSIQSQNALRNYEARDRNIQESNFQRVNWMSGVQVFVMVSVGLTQVLLIRSLFDDKSKIHKIMKART